MNFLYNIAIFFYRIAIGIASLFNPKAKLWVDGRRDWNSKLKHFVASNKKPIIWVHAASLGEFEQGRPIIENIKSHHAGFSIVLTFFSPSGYEIRKNYNQADYVCYMPLDTKSNASSFISIIDPEIAIIIKYEFWLNHLSVLREKNVKHYLVSGIFRDTQVFFKKFGGIFRNALNGFEEIFVQDANSAKLLKSIGFDGVVISGDTRFDRVIELKSNFERIDGIEHFLDGSKVIVMGSTWPKEEEIILEFIKANKEENYQYIIAPHEINSTRIDNFIKKCPLPSIKFSERDNSVFTKNKVLFIDNIGMLSKIYYYAHVVVIGGGFNSGLHNTLEAAVWGKPIIIGPKYKNFQEALDMTGIGAAFSVSDQNQLNYTLSQLLNDVPFRNKAGTEASKYCETNGGATDIVLNKLEPILNHKN